MTPEENLISLFPELENAVWEIASCRSEKYNCFAWAVHETHHKWDFGKADFWPDGLKKSFGIAYLIQAYRLRGFEVYPDSTEASTPDDRYEKIVVYELHGAGTHAAKLLSSGMWSSKIGVIEDIVHDTPEALSGEHYGEPFRYLFREVSPQKE